MVTEEPEEPEELEELAEFGSLGDRLPGVAIVWTFVLVISQRQTLEPANDVVVF